ELDPGPAHEDRDVARGERDRCLDAVGAQGRRAVEEREELDRVADPAPRPPGAARDDAAGQEAVDLDEVAQLGEVVDGALRTLAQEMRSVTYSAYGLGA